MDVKEVIFMNKGDGENSYAQNTSTTQKVFELSKPILENAIRTFLEENNNFLGNGVMNIADLGCSSSHNTYAVMSTVVDTVKNKCLELNCTMPEFQIYFNDLPGNDFNTLFKGLYSFAERYKDVSLFIMGAPGSFHGRLFPNNSLHLVYSNYAVHCLSKVPRLRDQAGLPVNKGKIIISKTSPGGVKEAYLAQFQEDLGFFFKSRLQEMVRNGRVVLLCHGRPSAYFITRESCYPWEPLAEAISALVSEEVIEEEKLDSFNFPYYTPSKQEVRDLVDKNGSFAILLLDSFTIEIGDRNNVWENGEKLSRNTRSYTESVISHHFGVEILDKLFGKLTQILIRDLASNQEPYKVTSHVIVLRRN